MHIANLYLPDHFFSLTAMLKAKQQSYISLIFVNAIRLFIP